MNEGVYRSPNWLKKYLDFEIHTGEDIKGKVSKKELRDKAKAEADRIKKEWEKRWKGIDEKKFRDFYREVFGKYIYSSDMTDIKKEWVGNFDIWKKYDNWIIKKKEEEDKQAEIKKELDNLFQRIVDDFTNNPFDDKFHTSSKSGQNTFHYRFENGDKFEITDNKIVYGNSTYTVGLLFRNKFISLANEIINKGMKRKRPSNSGYGTNSRVKKPSKSKYSEHPKGSLYQTLKDTVYQRKSQLSKMSKNDPERASLENELLAAERKLRDMKDKYKFENLISFEKFNL